MHKMQHQIQRSELLNESLFSGVTLAVPPKSLRLQFNLLGFILTLVEIKTLQTIFNDAVDLHYVLICRKLQNACYSMIDDTIISNMSYFDTNGDGYILIDAFVRVIEQHLNIPLLEEKHLKNILMNCSHKEKKNEEGQGRGQEVCCYLDMFTKSPVMIHGVALKESVTIERE